MTRRKSAASYREFSIFRTPAPALWYTVAFVDFVSAILLTFHQFLRSPRPGGKHRRHILGAWDNVAKPSSPDLFSEDAVTNFKEKKDLRVGCPTANQCEDLRVMSGEKSYVTC